MSKLIYIKKVSEPDTAYTLVDTVAEGVYSDITEGLEPTTEYIAKVVRTLPGYRNSLPAYAIFTTNLPPLFPPTDLTSSSTAGNQITLNWLDNSLDEDEFLIERMVNEGAWTQIATVAANVTTYVDTTVTSNFKYIYRVRGRRGADYSFYSNSSRSAIVYAYQFDGVNDYLTFPHSAALNFDRTNSFTIETWVKIPSVLTGNTKRLFVKYDSATSRGISFAVPSNNGKLAFILQSGAGNVIQVAAADPTSIVSLVAQNDKWYQFIASYNGSSNASGVKLYADGMGLTPLTVSNTLTATTVNTRPILIGSFTESTGFSAHYQAVTRVFNRVLTDAEVTTLYNKGLPLYQTSITGVVMESLVNNDTHNGTNFSVLESKSANNGTSSGMVANQKVLQNDFDAIAATNIQPYTGNKLYYQTFGNGGITPGAETSLTLTNSPFSDRRVNILYDPVNDYTYMSWMKKGLLGWNRENMLMYVDHANKFASPSFGAGYLVPGIIDGHPAATMAFTPNNEVLLGHEGIHNSPINFKRTTGKDISTLQYAGITPGTIRLSYPVLNTIGSNLFVFARGGDVVAEEFSIDYISKSTNNGTTWTTPKKVLNIYNNTGGTGEDRAYYVPIYDPNKLRFVIMMREGNGLIFTRIYYIDSTDGDTWRNYTNSFSKNVATTPVTRAEMDTNFSVLYDNENNIHVKCATVTPSGKVVILANDSVNNYRLLTHNGTAWVSKPVGLPVYAGKSQGGNTDKLDYWVIYPYSDTRFVIFRLESRNGFDVIVKYETLNAFTSWDAGTVISDTDKNHEQIQGTYNTNSNKMVIAANYNRPDGFNDMFIYEFTPGA